MMATEPAGFQAQFREFIFYVGATLQLFYWLALPVIAIWAVLIFKRAADAYIASLSGSKIPVVASPKPSASASSADSPAEDNWRFDEDDDESKPEPSAKKKPIKIEKFVD